MSGRPERWVLHGDCVEALLGMPEASVGAIVTDPPYGLEFMGKDWDAPWRKGGQAWGTELAGGADWNGRVRPRQGTAYPRSRQKRCRTCGRQEYSGTPCRCDVPEWEYIMAAPAQLRAFQGWCEVWAREALRVLKPGGHLLAFGGTRTYHRLACAVEDAGFEIRDTICWLYGSGFPKSLDVSKAIDKAAGAEREVVGHRAQFPDGDRGAQARPSKFPNAYGDGMPDPGLVPVTAPATPEAERWQGWGTALKPAHEPIVVARKPLAATVAANVLEHGTGALNVAGCALDFAGGADEAESKGKNRHAEFASGERARENRVYGEDARARGALGNYDAEGRWPPNVALDEAAAEQLDAQAGTRGAGNHPARRSGRPDEKVYGSGWSSDTEAERRPTGPGAASRFFYCPKASRAEREAGLGGREPRPLRWSSGEQSPGTFQSDGTDRSSLNPHPTVKPVELMRWLVRLVAPPGGLVLDPFCGSGTTGVACALEGLAFVGVERDPDYAEVARARIAWWERLRADPHGDAAAELAARRGREAREAAGQGSFEL